MKNSSKYFAAKNLSICIAALYILSGCASATPALDGRLSPDFGDAIDANIKAHAVAPTPAQKANTYIPADPSRTARARRNYREDTVEAPVPLSQSGN